MKYIENMNTGNQDNQEIGKGPAVNQNDDFMSMFSNDNFSS